MIKITKQNASGFHAKFGTHMIVDSDVPLHEYARLAEESGFLPDIYNVEHDWYIYQNAVWYYPEKVWAECARKVANLYAHEIRRGQEIDIDRVLNACDLSYADALTVKEIVNGSYVDILRVSANIDSIGDLESLLFERTATWKDVGLHSELVGFKMYWDSDEAALHLRVSLSCK